MRTWTNDQVVAADFAAAGQRSFFCWAAADNAPSLAIVILKLKQPLEGIEQRMKRPMLRFIAE